MGEAGTLTGSPSLPVTWCSLLGQGLLRGGAGQATSQQDKPEGNRVKAVPSPAPVPGPFLFEGQQEVRIKGWGGRREPVGGMGVYQVAGGLPKGQELARVAWLETYPGKEGGRRPTGPTHSHTGEPRADDWSAPWYMALPLSPPRRVRGEWAGQADPGPLGS